jgi:hypothetical protein
VSGFWFFGPPFIFSAMDKNREKFQILNHQLNLRKLEQVYGCFLDEGLSPVLIKGAAAARYYPKPFQRAFSDIDLAVAPGDFALAGRIVKENRLNVDLHRGLRHLDTLEWEELFEKTDLFLVGETPVRSLCLEDHLRVLCVHWLNDGGADRTKLWDIYFGLKYKSSGINWDRFWGVADEKRKKWLEIVVFLTCHYFGLEIGRIPGSEEFRLEMEKGVPLWVFEEVEKEWGRDERHIPLERVLGDKKRLVRQIIRRIPPNALQASIKNDDFIGRRRSKTGLLKNLFKRIPSSFRRILGN